MIIIIAYFACKILTRGISKKSDLGTYYFKFTDKNGKDSIIHDSGISTDNDIPQVLSVLKTEYHESQPSSLETPVKVYIGKNHDNLDVIIPLELGNITHEPDGLTYIISLGKNEDKK